LADLLKPLGPSIWTADGATVSVIGFRYPTRMAVIRLTDGGLFVWSPIALCDGLRAQVDVLGTVRFIVSPNSLHHLFLSEWQSAYPSAKVYAAPGLRERRRDLSFDGDLEEAPALGWAEHIDQVLMRGNLITTEVVFFHRASGTVLFTDLMQNFRPGWFKGWRAIVARLDGLVAREPIVPRKFRAAFVDRTAARAALQRILAWPIDKVLMAHGSPIIENGKAFVAHAFHWLSR
jgi:hypothetical protein